MSPKAKKNMPFILQVIQNAQDEILAKTELKVQLMPVIYYEPIVEEVRALFEEMCAYWGEDLLTVADTSREDNLPIKRKILWMAAKLHFPKAGFKLIGNLTNTLNHSSVLKGINTGYDLMQVQDPLFIQYFEPVKQFFNVTAEQ